MADGAAALALRGRETERGGGAGGGGSAGAVAGGDQGGAGGEARGVEGAAPNAQFAQRPDARRGDGGSGGGGCAVGYAGRGSKRATPPGGRLERPG